MKWCGVPSSLSHSLEKGGINPHGVNTFVDKVTSSPSSALPMLRSVYANVMLSWSSIETYSALISQSIFTATSMVFSIEPTSIPSAVTIRMIGVISNPAGNPDSTT
ncbi:MAG: Uncharacterised protein [Marine Group II euryarchaeote MED-G33]|nr:MAG: Uncharacterised protein [Marine Group II euryarchaeote MED-G33]